MGRLERLGNGFVIGPWRPVWILALCLAAGLFGGVLVTFATAPIALALGVGAVGGLALLRSPMLGLLSVIGVAILLPFAAVPLGVGFNPTFLNLALLATLTGWALRVALRQQTADGRWQIADRPSTISHRPVALAILVFMLMAVFAFVLGLGHATLTPTIARHFAELLLAIAFALVLVNLLQTEEQLTLATKAVILAGAAAASIGVFLYVLPDPLALRLLAPLRYLEYNVGLRYIRDDPRLPERAIGTSVDPNAFGGLLVLVTALTVAQLFSEQPLLRRSLIAPMALVMGVCLILTFSRSAMAGLVVALSTIAVLRYRRLLLWMVVAGAIFLILPQTQGYISHFVAGVQGQDLATKMRFGEYSDALRLIQRHPWFGVGFAGVPEIDIYLGVSSLYLLLAENMGLIGLAVFLVMMGLLFRHVWREWKTMDNQRVQSIVLGLGAGLAGAMVSGIFDHYFVNINFPHAVTLFWLFIGLSLAATTRRWPIADGRWPISHQLSAISYRRYAFLASAILLPLLVLGVSLAGSAGIARADGGQTTPIANSETLLYLDIVRFRHERPSPPWPPSPNSGRGRNLGSPLPDFGGGGLPAVDLTMSRYSPTPNSPFTIHHSPFTIRKIDPDLLKAALENAEGPHRFLVHLQSTEPDLTSLQALPSCAGEQRSGGAEEQRSRGAEETSPPPPRPSAPLLRCRRAIVERLQEVAESSQQGVRAYLSKAQAEGHVVGYKPFWIFNGLAVTGDASALMDLASRPDVAMIKADRKHWLPEPDQVPGTYTASPGPGLEWGVERIRAQMAWQALGIDGTGVVVASMDTGVDWQHPDLQPAYRGYNEKGLPVHVGNWYSVTDEEYIYPGDGHGHGTHTTATMVGQNGVGVAPGAKWIAVKVFHNGGFTFDSWIHDAFQWVMAPAGNPDLAPDVVNGSWGNDIPEDETLREDLRRVRAAGIVPVFAIGNNGPEPRSLGSPASYPEVIAVGALDQDGEVALFSSRGPSPWGEIKPEIVAPGTNVRSAVPGGGRQAWNGTSMATPHVSGVVALMLQADPGLDPDKIEEILKSTATPLGETVPNNTAGWGVVDAYRAVASVMSVGFLHGRVIRTGDGQPIAGAQVAVARREGEVCTERSECTFAHTTTDAAGQFELTLPPGPYELQISAFAYAPATVSGVRVSEDAQITRDISLALLPAGVLFGQVTDETTGGPLVAEVEVLGTPVSDGTDSTGRFAISLPPGEYNLKVVSKGHRVGHASVAIAVDQSTKQDFKLPPAPTILLVDSGGWYYGSQARFFTQTLDDLSYTYDIWPIKDLDKDLPAAKDLSAYEIVIWSSPRDAPGLIGATGAITNYLQAGGRLLLTGQDVGYWDGGGSRGFFAPYYRDYLRAVYVEDDAGYRQAYGAAGTNFEGLRFGLGRADSARNQRFPDLIAPLDDEHAQVAFHYGDPPAETRRQGDKGTRGDSALPLVTPSPPLLVSREAAGLVVGQCLPYRVVYLAFGFEGVETAAGRAEVLDRAIQTLTAPPPRLGVAVSADPSPVRRPGVEPAPSAPSGWQITPAGSTARHVVKVRNTGTAHDTFYVSLQGGHWDASLWAGDFSQPLSEGVRIAPCEAITVGVQVQVPAGTPRHTADQVILRAVSRSRVNGEPASDEIVLTTKTPAGVLLVDDDRWVNVEEYYQAALEGLGIGYDDWRVGWNPGEALGSPPDETLALYPVVIWFTGYDWFQTLTSEQERALGEYLANRGRLFFSSQDYLYTNGLRAFARDYLGVMTYTEDITSTVVTGEAGNPIGDGLGPFTLDYPFPNHSDAIEPVDGASVVFRGTRQRPVAVAYAPEEAFKSVFFAFPFEALSRPAAETTMGRVLDWLSPLHASAVSFDRTVAAEGGELTVTLSLQNDGPSADRARIRALLPLQAEYVVGSLKGADYDPIARVMRWETTAPAGETTEVMYRIQLAPSVPDGTMLAHRVEIEDAGGIKLQRVAEVRVDAPDLSASQKVVDLERATLGDVLTYAITLHNRGTVDGGLMSLYDELPHEIELVQGSLSASSGRTTSDGRRILWEGRVTRDKSVSISYRARVLRSGIITNVARVNDGAGVTTWHAATTIVSTKLYLPLLMRYEAP